jgi:hypothetical protein
MGLDITLGHPIEAHRGCDFVWSLHCWRESHGKKTLVDSGSWEEPPTDSHPESRDLSTITTQNSTLLITWTNLEVYSFRDPPDRSSSKLIPWFLSLIKMSVILCWTSDLWSYKLINWYYFKPLCFVYEYTHCYPSSGSGCLPIFHVTFNCQFF